MKKWQGRQDVREVQVETGKNSVSGRPTCHLQHLQDISDHVYLRDGHLQLLGIDRAIVASWRQSSVLSALGARSLSTRRSSLNAATVLKTTSLTAV